MISKKTKILSTVSMYHALNDGAISVIPILFPIFRIIFDLSYTQIGIITGGALSISIISQLAVGHLSDGSNCRTTLSFGILLLSISFLLYTQIQGFITLLLITFLLRFSSSFFHPIGVGWISRIYKKDRLDWAMGIHSGFADIGAFIAISTTLFATEIFGWEFPLYIWSFAGAAIVLLGLFNTKDLENEYLSTKKIHHSRNLKKAFNDAFALLKRIKTLIPSFMITGASWGVVGTYMPLLLVERTDLSLTFVGLIVSIWIGTGSIASFYYGRITSIFGRRKVIMYSYLTIAVSALVITFFTSLPLIIIALFAFGITVFLTYPALASFTSEITDESSEGKNFSVIFTLQLGGGTIVLFIGGILSDLYGIWTPFAIIGVASLLITILLFSKINKPLIQT